MMLTPHVHEIRHVGCSPYAPLPTAGVPARESKPVPRCGGSEVIEEKLTPRLDHRDPACEVREWECPGCVDCLQDGDPVECAECAWNDQGELIVTRDPIRGQLWVHGDEGESRGYCLECDTWFGHDASGLRRDATRRRYQ